MNADTAALAARLQSELAGLEQIVERAENLLTKAVEQDKDSIASARAGWRVTSVLQLIKVRY